MATLKVYNGSSWDTAVMKTYDGSAWVEKAAFWDGSAWQDLYTSGPSVSPNGSNIVYSIFSHTTLYAHLRIATDGVEYYNGTKTSSATSSSRGNWLDSGSASEVWVERVISSGSLSVDAGSGRLNLGTERLFGVTRPVNGTKSCSLTFNYYDAASGGSLLGSSGLLTLSVTLDYL